MDMYIDFKLLDTEKYSDAMLEPRNAKKATNILRLITMISSIFAVASLIARHYYKRAWMNKYLNDDNDT